MSAKTITLTPELKAQYDAANEAALDKAIRLADDASWTQSKKEDTITFFTRTEEGSSFNMIKSITYIPVPMEKVLEQLNVIEEITPDMDAKKRDGVVRREIHVLDPSDEHHQGMFYLALDSGSRFVTNRDFLMYRRYYEKDGKYYIVNVSVEHPDFPAKDGFVRAKILIQVYIADVDPEHADAVRLRFIVHADPCGSVPSMIYNVTATNQGYAIKKIHDKLVK